MSPVKTPTSSLSATELLVNKLWYRTKLKIERSIQGGVPEVPAPRPSPITALPQDLVEMIIAYLVHNTPSLLACSLTCYSLYIAAVPHLHHTLTTDNWTINPEDKGLRWPKPLRKSYELGVLPLVKRFRIRMENGDFGPNRFNSYTLRCFSALTNLQMFGFTQNLGRCFGHLSPTLRFLALKKPRGACRQILYFVGLFPNLQDLKLTYATPEEEQDGVDDVSLVPLSVPPLRGRLTLTCFTREKLVGDMIVLFGGLRFRSMDIYMVTCVQLLLDACAETLEAMRLYPSDPYSEAAFNRINRLGTYLFRRFNLSRVKSLRTLETMAEAVTAADDTVTGSLRAILSTVTSPRLIDVVYRDFDVDGVNRHPQAWVAWLTPEYREFCAQRHRRMFKVFSEIHGAREFRLVLCVDILDPMVTSATGTLEQLVKAEKARGGWDHLLCEPLVITERRSLHTRYLDGRPGSVKGLPVSASAL